MGGGGGWGRDTFGLRFLRLSSIVIYLVLLGEAPWGAAWLVCRKSWNDNGRKFEKQQPVEDCHCAKISAAAQNAPLCMFREALTGLTASPGDYSKIQNKQFLHYL